MTGLAIETHALSKQFEQPRGWRRLAKRPAIRAVHDVTLSVQEGELFGLLGPNGAGKTTLVKLLCTLIRPSSGEAIVSHYPLHQTAAIRATVGLVVSDERSFFWRLTGRQNLEFFAAMHGLPSRAARQRAADLLTAVDLAERADERFSNYSSGMKQRLAIARSLLHQPRLLFLDEPSRSLDPSATQRLHGLILRLMGTQGVTVFLITHDLLEAEKLCHRVAVMHQGRIRAVDRPAALRQQLQPYRHYTVVVDHLPGGALESLRRLAPDLSLYQHEIQFRASENGDKLTRMLDCLRDHQVTIQSVSSDIPTLEDVFTSLTQD